MTRIDRRFVLAGGFAALTGCAGVSEQALREQTARQIVDLIFTPDRFLPFLAPLKQIGNLGAQLLAMSLGVNLGPVLDLAMKRLVEDRITGVRERAVQAMAAEFTSAELLDLLAAYRSPAGAQAASAAFALGARGTVPVAPAYAPLTARADRVVAGVALDAFGGEFDINGEFRNALLDEVTRALTGS